MERTLTPELLLAAYATGYFPMSEGRNCTEIYWYQPEMRGIFPLDRFHVPKSLHKALRRNPFEMRIDYDFKAVIHACAERPNTWINTEIIQAYTELWELGFAHSIEVWQNNKLVGGLYGVALGSAFFGESMFSYTSNASKAALIHLISHLKIKGYTLLDTQYINDHLKQFGVEEIPHMEYMKQLKTALAITPIAQF